MRGIESLQYIGFAVGERRAIAASDDIFYTKREYGRGVETLKTH